MARPPASSTTVSDRMARQRREDTGPEVAVRRELHRRGLRYRVHRRPVPTLRRTADVVFGPAHVAVMIDGCFWHGCPQHATSPRANAAWWREKLDRNIERDRETDQVLADAGWHVMRFWEHEDPLAIADAIEREVTMLRTTPGMAQQPSSEG